MYSFKVKLILIIKLEKKINTKKKVNINNIKKNKNDFTSY